MRRSFYGLIAHYLSLYIRPQDRVVEVGRVNAELEQHFTRYESLPNSEISQLPLEAEYVLLNGTIQRVADIQELLAGIRGRISDRTRLLVVYYSALWKPLVCLATRWKMRPNTLEENWVAHEDIDNLLTLTDFQRVRRDAKILCPLPIPLLAHFLNRYLAPLPGFRSLCAVNILVARPLPLAPPTEKPSVSVVVPARNESGNIADILRRCPAMGPNDELIFVEGNSTDDTWDRIQQEVANYKGPLHIVTARQSGKGKGDAVRKGFSLATRDILMILDADLTAPPEELPNFYRAITEGKGEYINGSRLVYPMEKRAMRFFNLLGNKAFALGFSFVLGQRFKDTLCGTKVISRANYEQLAAHRAYFGEFDPFGDFDLIFGAARLGLKIVEVPVHYRERTYGETNINRWRDGAILLRMLAFAAARIKFI